jgi:hypothetical protein
MLNYRVRTALLLAGAGVGNIIADGGAMETR